MNSFELSVSILLYVISILCILLPYSRGRKKTAYIVGSAMVAAITIELVFFPGFFAMIPLIIILMFQIVFISYWAFISMNMKRTGQVTAVILSVGFISLILSPWISDWMFSNNDVKRILSVHQIVLTDDFSILENEAFGLRDTYQTFSVHLSKQDFNRISHQIKTSKNFKGFFKNNEPVPSASYDQPRDPVDFETDQHITREYWTNDVMEDGTYHFRFQLDKSSDNLDFTGSNE